MMKTIHKPICLLLIAACLYACSSGENENPTPGDDAVIRLSAGLPASGVQSKAPINSGDKFVPAVAGWESSAAAGYAAAPTWKTATSEITASATAQAVSLVDQQVYNVDRNIRTYMKAWYPQGTLADGRVAFAGDASYRGDGTDDVLLSGEVSGSRSDRADKVLAFDHMTTQLKFVIKAGDGLAANTKLLKIELKDVSIPGGIDLTSNLLIAAARETLAVPDIDGSLVIGTTETGDAAGSPVMILPPAVNTVTLKVTTSAAVFDGIVAKIDTDTEFQAGKAYSIVLTFSNKNVELSGATLAEWSTGTGSGQIE